MTRERAVSVKIHRYCCNRLPGKRVACIVHVPGGYLESARLLRHNRLFREDVAPSSPLGEGLIVSWLANKV